MAPENRKVCFVALLLCLIAQADGFICKTKEHGSIPKGVAMLPANHKISEGVDPVFPWFMNEGYYKKQDEEDVVKVIKYLEEKTCVRMPKVSSTYKKKRIRFQGTDGCVTVWPGNELISIGIKGCGLAGIAHEIGHAFGHGHEQGRNDSDKYIKFLYGGPKGNGFIDILGIPFDYFSIMQYPLKSDWRGLHWAARDRRITFMLGAKDLNQPVQGSELMTFNDIKRFNYQMKCNSTCPNVDSTWCENQGYLAPPKTEGARCECNCPYGTSGERCEIGEPIFISDFCGGTYDSDTVLKTPGYDQGKRTGNSRCTYIVKGKPGKQIKITWLDFNIGYYNKRCHNGFIEVRTTNMWVGNFYCTGLIPKNAVQKTTPGMDLAIMIEPQYHTGGRGFKAKVEYLDGERPLDCSENNNTIEIHENSSPINIVYGTQKKNRKCMWNFWTRWPNTRIQLRAIKFIMRNERYLTNYVDVFPDGKDSPLVYRTHSAEMTNVTSINNKMTVESILTPYSYFEAEVVAVKSFDILFPENVAHCNSSKIILKPGEKGSIVSPNYYGLIYKNVPTQYPPNVVCNWSFKSNDPKTKSIKINFDQKKVPFDAKLDTFDIDCEKDTLKVYVLNPLPRLPIRICKKGTYTFQGHEIGITFASDARTQKKGFFANVWASSESAS